MAFVASVNSFFVDQMEQKNLKLIEENKELKERLDKMIDFKEKYNHLNEDYSNLAFRYKLMRKNGNNCSDIKDELERAKDKIEDLNTQLNEGDNWKWKMEDLQKEVDSLNEENNKLFDDNKRLSTQNEELEKKAFDLEEDFKTNDELKTKISNLEFEIDNLNQEIKNQKTTTKKQKKNIKLLKRKLKQAQSENSFEGSPLISKYKKSFRRLLQERKSLKQSIIQLKNRNEDLNYEIETSQKRVQEMIRELDMLSVKTADYEELKRRFEESENVIYELEKEIDTYKEKIRRLEGYDYVDRERKEENQRIIGHLLGASPNN